MLAVDLHQHLWPATFVELLRRRTRAPYLRDWQLVTDGEPAVRDPAPRPRGRAAHRAGPPGRDRPGLRQPLRPARDRVPAARRGRRALIDAWHDGRARRCRSTSRAWASVRRSSPTSTRWPACWPGRSSACSCRRPPCSPRPRGSALATVLRVAELSDKPVFVHPGPTPAPRRACPRWWAAVVDYVAQLQAAWWAWHASAAAPLFPRLRLVLRRRRRPGAGPPRAARRPRRPARRGRPGRLRRHLVVRRAGARRPDPRARHRRARARQRPALRRAAASRSSARPRPGRCGSTTRTGRSGAVRTPVADRRDRWRQWHEPSPRSAYRPARRRPWRAT